MVFLIAVGLAGLARIVDRFKDLGRVRVLIDTDDDVFVGGSGFFGIGVVGSLSNLGTNWVAATGKVLSDLLPGTGLRAIIFTWNTQG